MSNNVETKSVCSSSSRPQVVAHLRNVVPMIATKKKESGIQSPRCVVATSKQVASNKPASAVDSPSLQKAVVQGVHRAGDKSTAVASTSPQGKSSSSRQHSFERTARAMVFPLDDPRHHLSPRRHGQLFRDTKRRILIMLQPEPMLQSW